MPNPKKSPWRRFAVTTGAAALIVAVTSLAAVAIARTLALQVDRSAKVTNAVSKKTRTEAIVLNSSGRAVYDLNGDRRGHAECTKANTCFMFWPPVTVSSPKKLSKAPSIKGKLGTWHRNGFFQVTLNGHPLYTFSQDHKKRAATGEGVNAFGGIWHVIRPSTTKVSSGGSMPSSSSTSSTSSSAPCLYPPC
jgi:predicted lipoprotein with Yx(FWY)xxD motif